MEGWIIGIIAVALILGFILFLRYREHKSDRAKDWKWSPWERSLKLINAKNFTLTPGGAKVYFEQPLTPQGFSLPACDLGIRKAFEKAECAGYAVNRGQHNISIISLPSENDSQGDPAFRVFISHTSEYYNSEWDKATCPGLECDHYVLAAGQTVAVGTPYGDVIVVPHHIGKDEHLATVVEYEMEHVLLSYYDPVKFEETKYHLNGAGHPLIPDCAPTGAVGFMNRVPKQVFCYSDEIRGVVRK